MHSRHSVKPVGKCKGCPLNFKKRCGVFENPGEMWAKGKCSGYKNQALVDAFNDEAAENTSDAAREARRQRAESMKSEPHHDGIVNPGGSRW